ncbi:hypothetical protein [Streptomyces sp. RFCAC02]|uniref:hypothetical protein n=1 Tax=Streptomyces sp. RFCAC02 TaxID=2499143 RepID=UPI001020B548|nr:hypothetical protein [Streptomyces sp. RFCAC02]
MPETVCGASVDGDVLLPLLPGGSEFFEEERTTAMGDRYEVCGVGVDDRLVLGFDLFPYSEGGDPVETVQAHARDVVETIDIAGNSAAIWSDGVMTFIRCRAEETQEGGPYISLEISAHRNVVVIEDDAERQRALEAFAESYVAGVEEARGCDV